MTPYLVRVLWRLVVALLCAGSVSAQELDATKLYLFSGGVSRCVGAQVGTGAPGGGVTCDVYLDYATGDLWTKRTGGWTVVPRLETANTWTASQIITNTEPVLTFNETDQGTDLKAVRIDLQGGVLSVQTLNDALSAVLTTTLMFSRAGALAISGGITAGSGAVGIVNSVGKIPALTSAYITSLAFDASNLTSGTMPGARLPQFTGGDVATGAAGSVVLAIQNGVIINAQVSASAAIAWSKLDKTGSSLADLTTRSASDLTSGNLAYARLPTGSGTWTNGGVSLSSTLAVASDATFTTNAGTSVFTSQTTGWRVDNTGSGDFRYLWADELRIKLFTADVESVLAGSQRITKSYSTISQTFTCPAAAATSTLWVNDNVTYPDAAVFVSGDQVVIHALSRTVFGPFTVSDCVGAVTVYADGTGGNAKQQSWTFTRGAAANGGNMISSTTVAVTQLVQDFGVTGNGYLESTATDGAAGVNAPYTQVVTFATAPIAANLTTRCRLGNLKGITTTLEYGLLCGSYSATSGNYFRVSDQNIDFQGISMKWWDSTNAVIVVSPSGGNPYLSMGNAAPSSCCTTAGLFLGWVSAAAKAKVSFYSDANNFFTFDGTNVSWKGANASLSTAGNLTATGGTIGGWTLSSTTLAGGSVTIDSAGSIRAGQSAYNTGTGFWLGTVSGTPKFSVGNSSGARMSWDGTTFTIAGTDLTLSGASTTYVAGAALKLGPGSDLGGTNDEYGISPFYFTAAGAQATPITRVNVLRNTATPLTATKYVTAITQMDATGWNGATSTAAATASFVLNSGIGAGVAGGGAATAAVLTASTTTVSSATIVLGVDTNGYTQTNGMFFGSNNTEALGIAGSAVANLNFYKNAVTKRLVTVQAAVGGTQGGVLFFYTKPDTAGDVIERMRIDQGGYVGIGAAPSFPLDVSGVAGKADIRAVSTSATGAGYARLYLSTVDQEWRIVNDSAGGSGALLFYNGTSAATRMSITAAGLVTMTNGLSMSGGDIVPSADNTRNVGLAGSRFTLVRAVTITPGDLSFENGWSITESQKAGIAEKGLAILDDTGELVAFIGRTGLRHKGGLGKDDVDDVAYVPSTAAERAEMDATPEARLKTITEPVLDADGRPVLGHDGVPVLRTRRVPKTPADVRAMPDPSKGKTTKQRGGGL